MNILRFKTNINCGNCLRAVTPFLNSEPEIEKWQVDLEHPERILTVEGEVDASLVTDLLKEAGYKGEALP